MFFFFCLLKVVLMFLKEVVIRFMGVFSDWCRLVYGLGVWVDENVFEYRVWDRSNNLRLVYILFGRGWLCYSLFYFLCLYMNVFV